MKRFSLIFLMVFVAGMSFAQSGKFNPPDGKEIYIPRDLATNDFTDPNSKWSYARMATTPNIVVFWEKPFGDDLSKAPDLEGHNMKVDINNLLYKLEEFYSFFRDTLSFIRPHSKAEKYRMMVMLNYSLEGTAYGGDYDGQIGALWISPNRVQDEKLNCIAHELGHSFQSQIGCDGEGVSWGGGGIFEMASQWMLWQVNPEWVTDENYHWEAFKKLTHKAFLDMENIYHSPYVLEYWGEKRGRQVIADLFRMGKKGEDPAQTYMRMFKLNESQMADEMFDCYRRLVTFDFKRVKNVCAKYANQISSPVKRDGKGTVEPVDAPETYGFNVIPVKLPKPGKSVTVTFNGVTEKDGVVDTNAGWRYGLVAVKSNGEPEYGQVYSLPQNKIKFKYDKKTRLRKLWLVVMGAPAKYESMKWNGRDEKKANINFPYTVTVK